MSREIWKVQEINNILAKKGKKCKAMVCPECGEEIDIEDELEDEEEMECAKCKKASKSKLWKENKKKMTMGENEIKNSENVKKDEKKVFAELFPELPAQSIDVGVIEKLENILTIPSEFGWNDIGCWTSLADVLKARSFG